MGKAQAPKKWNQLYQNLFERRAPAETLDILSRGLDAVTANAGRLIEDATLLVNAQRYGSASFMLATANEEMAKSYILLDMCRLDFARRQSILSNLCHAFYDHVTKYAYTQIVRFSGFRSMAHVKQVWDVNLIKWWSSGDVESGEPDMPHATYFSREMPLYVDFIDYDQEWFTPQTDTRKLAFEPFLGSSELIESIEALTRLRLTSEAALYSSQCLRILNETFNPYSIGEETSTEQLSHLYEGVAQNVETEIGIPKEKFFESALNEWPLYAFVNLMYKKR